MDRRKNVLRNTMKRVILAVLVVTMITASMVGCTKLAKEEENNSGKSRENVPVLIGAFVTTEPLEKDKIYGESYEDDYTTKYKFEGVEGVLYYRTLIKHPEGDVIDVIFDEYFTYDHIDIRTNEGDTENLESYTINLSLYYNEEHTDDILFINLVYVDGKGKPYIEKAGMGEAGLHFGDLILTHKYNNEITEEGKTERVEYVYNLTIEASKASDKICVINMADDKAISRKEYDVNNLPETIVVDKEAEYVIIENVKDNKVVERKLVEKNGELELYKVLVKGEGCFLKPVYVNISGE